MNNKKKIRVIVTSIGLDGHIVGAVTVSKILRDAGMEVVHLGVYQTPEMIVGAAIEEGVDVIGISSHASNYSLIIDLMDLLKRNNMNNILVICGGNIPIKQISKLKDAGVSEVFTPRSSSESIVNCILNHMWREKG
jgi:methylmalonyl-CoA mutase C-terminal domain/subunit